MSKITKEVSLNKEENRVKSWSVPVIRRYRSDKMSIKKKWRRSQEKSQETVVLEKHTEKLSHGDESDCVKSCT